MTTTLKMNDGTDCEVIRMFDGRAIVWMGGARVLAVLTSAGWDCMTGEPVRPGEELDTLNGLIGAGGTTVAVTDPDGNTTVYEDPS